jgi:hypothetical protein
MEPGEKKTESEVKVNNKWIKHRLVLLHDDIRDLHKRMVALEEHLRSLDHGNEQGNDVRDGGWFD